MTTVRPYIASGAGRSVGYYISHVQVRQRSRQGRRCFISTFRRSIPLTQCGYLFDYRVCIESADGYGMLAESQLRMCCSDLLTHRPITICSNASEVYRFTKI